MLHIQSQGARSFILNAKMEDLIKNGKFIENHENAVEIQGTLEPFENSRLKANSVE